MKIHVITSWEEGTEVQQFSSQMKIILYFDAAGKGNESGCDPEDICKEPQGIFGS